MTETGRRWRESAWALAVALAGGVFYHLLAVPLIAEYAFAGPALAVGLALGVLGAVPRGRRLETAAIALAFLYALQAARNLAALTPLARWAGFLAAAAGLALILRLAVRVPLWRSLPPVALAALLAARLDPVLYPALTAFEPRWVSPPLTAQAKIPFFTPVVADLDGDGRAEIAAVSGEPPDRRDLPLTGYRFVYEVFRWDGRRLRPWPPAEIPPQARRRLVALVRNEHPAAPPLAAAWSVGGDGRPGFTLRGAADPFAAVAAADPGRLPFAVLGLTLRSVSASHDSWAAMEARHGDPAADPSLTPLAADRLVLYAAATADVDGDGRLEQLVNRPDEGAFIRSLAGGATLWEAPNPSFRFEAFGRLGAGAEPEMIAQDKGFWGWDERRYLGGYRWDGRRLARLWKVFVPGVVNPVLADVDGDGRRELVAALYGSQRIVVLARHGLPVTALVWAAALAAALVPPARRVLGRRGALAPACAAGAGLLLVLGASLLPSPALHLPSGRGPAAPDAGARPAPEAGRVLAEAVRRMRAVEMYSFQGEVITYVGRRRVPSVAVGAVAPGGRVRAHGSIWGDSYDSYRVGSTLHLGSRVWHRREVPGAAFPPSLGDALSYLPGLAEGARVLPRTELVQRARCSVYVLYPEADQVRRLIPGAVSPAGGVWDQAAPGRFLVKVWVGEGDGLIYQVQTLFDLPLPAATGLRQKTIMKYWNFNDPRAEVRPPEDLQPARARSSRYMAAVRAAKASRE